jgi:hypothetical protein
MDDALLTICDRLHKFAATPQFAFEPPLSAAELDDAERTLGVLLPDAFRRVLLELTRGHREHLLLCPERASAGIARPFPLDLNAVRAVRSSGTPIDGPHDVDGTLEIWDHGCGEETYLVVTGPLRGWVLRHFEGGWIPEPIPDEEPSDAARWLAWWLTVW